MTTATAPVAVPARRPAWLRWLRALLWVVIAAEVALLLTGRRVLVNETIVRPEDSAPTVVEDYGDLRKEGPSLVCRYFNGRRLITQVFRYHGAGLLGRAACPASLNDNGE